MKLDLTKFYQTCNPTKTLVLGNGEDRKYYIDACEYLHNYLHNPGVSLSNEDRRLCDDIKAGV